jgi:DNA-binding MarR family transcriptional regulator
VAERTGSDPNTASQVVRGLERRGLVRRERDERDSRALTLTLTPEGLELARLCTQRARALNREFFADVDADAMYATLTGLAADARRRRAAPPTRRP